MSHRLPGQRGRRRSGTASDIAIQAEQCRLTKREIAELGPEQTGQSVGQVEKDADQDRWFTADEAKTYGSSTTW